MKQENRFVAQLFHYLAPFVDMERALFICVDGGAAKHHAGRAGSPLTDDADVPDLWLALIGKKGSFGIGAKVIDQNSISVRQGQLRAWRTKRYWPLPTKILGCHQSRTNQLLLLAPFNTGATPRQHQ